MDHDAPYPIGTPGIPWGEEEKQHWFARQQIKRAYADEVLAKLEPLHTQYDIVQYGQLSIDPQRYPLFAAKSRNWRADRPAVLITGGVHGYETSGVQGALRFLVTRALDYQQQFNFIVAPCVSPWGYETINRWNPAAVDPNRSFITDSPAPEAAQLMALVASQALGFCAHFDLHETTDTDNSEFRPALAARDGKAQDKWDIPDGFYLVGHAAKPAPDFQRAIIAEVKKITHIAPPDGQGKIIGETIEQHGVINYAKTELGLCGGFTDAPYVTTTEVYPDSPKTTPENCIEAQVAAIVGGLEFILNV